MTRLLQEEDTKKGFTCGEPLLDEYFRQHAWTNHVAGIARCYVLDADDSQRGLAGFYTLSARSVERELLSAALSMRLPRYPLPVVLVGRFAISTPLQGRGYGKQLMRDALSRSVNAANVIGAVGIYLDSKTVKSTTFYSSLGFVALGASASPQPMFLAMETVRESLG